ncbi:RNA polymerase recycling motor HelD [Fredinandcohnia quinoae]|uniref:UvrD-helicase domain-containing protein n=1 Tax=Fredinandcohnia quinoae TaxID=2918902 RepID=A0AAW5E5I5_9BACI|nr:RNA polymerase recycling motor HelD [Fredinandcohnia sp. SECRCQ15]MCH1627758.1 UvrD-helicase domain-containing protein [Fredinandcohnia sp. SECRCQ15]
MEKMNVDWKLEQERVDHVLEEIDQKVKKLDTNIGGLKKDIVELRKDFWNDITVNLDEPDDVIETFTSIKQQAELIGERERSHKQIHKQLKTLDRLKYSPYFGRFDFLEDDEKEEEKVYIGIASLLDGTDENFLIYDWRAPISSLYYDYYPGPAEYNTPFGTIQGDMSVKRQFIIKSGEIKSMFDTGVTIGDEMLQEVLGNNSNTQMKSIVATIQKEQNKIIRNEKSRYLIVQGVAGSGKTSAALQRVAYLLYRYREQLNSSNIMLFSPNPLFNSYVATVLPELGEDNMQQSTFQEYVEYRLGKTFKVEDPFTQMEFLLGDVDHPDYETRLTAIHYKASIGFKDRIDKYIEALGTEGLLFKNIKFRGKIIISKDEIKNTFYSLDRSNSIPNRMSILAEWIGKELFKIERKERGKDWVTRESELMDKAEYLAFYQELQRKRQSSEETFDDFELEQKLIAKEIVRKHFKPLKQAVKRLEFLNVQGVYRQLFEGISSLKPFEGWEQVCRFTVERIKKKELTYEDATPYLYLQDQLEGKKSNTLIRHLFIDEAQDYSPFQFEYLKQLFSNCRMTILGDYNQAIYAHSMNAPTLLSPEIFEEGKYERVELTKSYRSTKEIVEFTKCLINGGEMIEPFNRPGLLPTLTEVGNESELHDKIVERVNQLQDEGHQTIAIICKTAIESKEAFDALQKKLPVRVMDNETYSFDKGILILPAYLAKGIEFDAVIIYNGSNDQYGREYERKLFYTACTRAMHELDIFTIGKRTMLMNEVPKENYYLK